MQCESDGSLRLSHTFDKNSFSPSLPLCTLLVITVPCVCLCIVVFGNKFVLFILYKNDKEKLSRSKATANTTQIKTTKIKA